MAILPEAIRNEEAQRQIETRHHVMDEIKRYVEGNNGKYDAFGLMDDMMERVNKTNRQDTQTRMNDVMNELTNNHEYWSKYGESYEGKYAEQQKQKNAEAFREGPETVKPLPQAARTESQRTIQNTLNKASNLQGASSQAELQGDILK